MPEVTHEEVSHVCLLARLDLTDDEIERVRGELNRIMAHFQELQALDTTGIAITSHAIPMSNVYREDAIGPSLPVDKVVANAPDSVEGFFRTSLFMEE